MTKVRLFFTAASWLAIMACGQTLPYQNPELSAEQRAADLCSRLTLDEKISLMQHTSPAIPRLDIPQFNWWSEALHGVARNGFATVFPATIGMAASFNDNLVFQVFQTVSDEARAKANIARHSGEIKQYQSLSFWTPNINIFRDPRWGRGQETYGEDPYLTGRLGLSVVRGLQGPDNTRYRKLLACAKHFAVHSGPEWNRHEFNVEHLPERDLWETYIPAFKTLVQEGHVAEVMCAYQSIDGQPCCGNNRYLQHILRQELGFKGLVVSDCGAISDFWVAGRHGYSSNAHEASAKAVLAGTDVECGSNYRTLNAAVAAGEITESDIDVSVRRLLKARFELGDFDPEEMVEWQQISPSVIACPSHRQLALQMARESMTLLKNDNHILPLKKQGLKMVVMGPNANDSVMHWANYYGFPLSTTTVLEGIRDIVGPVKYVGGCGLTHNEVEESRFNEIVAPDGQKGMLAHYYNGRHSTGDADVVTHITEPINLSNGGNTVFATGVNLEHFTARYEGTFIPTRDEEVIFNAKFDDCARVIVNGDTIINVWNPRARILKGQKVMQVRAGQRYDIQIDYLQGTDMAVMQFDIIHKVQLNEREILQSVGDAEVVIFVGGISASLEGEEMRVDEEGFKGGDRTHIELPQSQRDVIALLHRSGKKVVLVNCSGSAMGLVPESEHADAILQAWYPGEAGGTAVAEVLFGDYNPNGKLPITFYKNVDQLPEFMDYAMKGRTYRYFQGEPLYPFGYGLSYTTFEISKPVYKQGKVMVSVENTGERTGTETVQVYIKKEGDKDGPIKTLRGYKKVTLEPKEKRLVAIDLPREQFEWWDTQTNTIRVTPGTYVIMCGSSSQDSDLKTTTLKIK